MLPEKVQNMVGKSSEPFILEVDRSSIKKYADAVGDRNPLYWDEEYAQNSRFGTLIAPPGFYGWPVQWENTMPFYLSLRAELIETFAKEGFSTILDGGIEYEFFKPVRIGDVLSSVVQITNINRKESKGRTMFFSELETKYTNQNGMVCATARQTLVIR